MVLQQDVDSDQSIIRQSTIEPYCRGWGIGELADLGAIAFRIMYIM